MSKRDHIGDDGNSILPGIRSPSSSVRRSGQPNILIHQMPSSAAASDVSGDATALEGFEVLGAVAVRVMARFSLPRMSLVPARAGEEIRPSQRLNSMGEDQS